jgi:DNA replication and repair protein RecF
VDQLEYWTESMVTLGMEIYDYRHAFFNFLGENRTEYMVKYLPNIVGDYRARLQGNLEKEIRSATSQYGPHKDDFVFYLGERELASYGSRGEQRGAVLFFKKVHLLYVGKERQTKPVLLLDDIFSEFDRGHREEIAEIVRGYQTFITGTEEQFFRQEKFEFNTVLEVKRGGII